MPTPIDQRVVSPLSRAGINSSGESERPNERTFSPRTPIPTERVAALVVVKLQTFQVG
jgi:hypothetical protein